MLQEVEAPGRLASITSKFDRLAPGYSSHDYADAARYFGRRVEVVRTLGPVLPTAASVLDLGCGDGGMAAPILDCGYGYRGVDASDGMVAEARRRLGRRCRFEVADLERFTPAEPVDLTVCFRAVIYARDRRAFFRHVAEYTRTKFVFDFNPRACDRGAFEADLAAAGFTDIAFRPFFLPQLMRVRTPLRLSLRCLESVPPLARVGLRVRGIWVCAASGAWSAPG